MKPSDKHILILDNNDQSKYKMTLCFKGKKLSTIPHLNHEFKREILEFSFASQTWWIKK